MNSPTAFDEASAPTRQMGALTWDGQKLAYTATQPVPQPGPNEALVRVLRAGICNTDLEIVKGYMGFTGVLGHEFVGLVERCPDAPEWEGVRVCVDINAACDEAENMHECRVCEHPHHCPNRSVIGIVQHHGAFAEYVVAPIRNLFAVPENVDNDAAVFVEPLAAAFEIPEQVHIQPKDKVMVLGDGKLGLLIAMVMALYSRNVTLLGRHPEKLAMVEGLGIETALSSNWQETKCADMVVEATGTASGLEQAIQLVKPRRTVVLKSTIANTQNLNLSPLVVDEITLLGSRCGPFDVALAALAEGKVPVKRLIQRRFALEEGASAIQCAGSKGMLKVLLEIPNSNLRNS